MWTLYADDPHWVPPLGDWERELVNYRPHPFYLDAEVQTFLAYRDGRVCGRIAAIVNHAYNRWHQEQTGFFGFFEAVNDHDVAHALLDAACAWLAARGQRIVRGPFNPSITYQCGLLIDGFDSPPTFLMPYNPPYYAALLEGRGFAKAQDLLSFHGSRQLLSQRGAKLRAVAEDAQRRLGATLRQFDMSRFPAEIATFYDVYNRSLRNMWGFTPVSAEEVRHAETAERLLTIPEMTAVAEVGGKPVGAGLSLLDYSPLVKRIDGRLHPLGRARLLWGRRKLKRVRMVCLFVLPEFQLWGLGPLLLWYMIENGLKWGVDEVDFCWVMEGNLLSRGTAERGGAVRGKTFRIYERML